MRKSKIEINPETKSESQHISLLSFKKEQLHFGL